MKAGPKGTPTAPPLDLRRLPKRGGARCIAFCERYITVPKGTGAKHRLKLRPWQREIVRGVLDEPRPRQALVAIPAGNGKSTLAAAIGLYGLLGDGVEGAQVLVVASDERQARIIFRTAKRMVELDKDLSARVQVFADHLLEPRTDSVFMALPADPGSLQGWDPSMALVDELHVVTDDTYEAMAARAGKRDRSLLLAISTPPKAGDDGVMRRLVDHGREGADPSFYFTEFAAPAGCALDDEDAWQVANPALDDSCTATPSGRPCRPRCARTPSAGTGWASGWVSTPPGCLMAPGPPAATRPGASPMGPRSFSPSTVPSTATPRS
jgi:phage terminase large subunit-like protein